MMSTAGSSGGMRITSDGGLTPTGFLDAMQVSPDRREILRREAARLARAVPLRRPVYRRLAGLLRGAMREGKTVRQVAARLKRAARRSPEAALLLCDLYEVLAAVERERRERMTQQGYRLRRLVERLERTPYAGEEVLF